MKKTKKNKNKESKIAKVLGNSVINYMSDLFIVMAVLMWIVDNIYESIIATIVTISSIRLSEEVGYACYDTSMWSSIGSNVALPLSVGVGLWLAKCAAQHAIANSKGKRAHMDFPKIPDTDIEYEEDMSDEFLNESEALG